MSNPDAKGLTIAELRVVSEGATAGNLALSNVNPSSDSASSSVTARLYVDGDATIRGTCEFSNEFGSSKQTLDLNLKNGWNIISADTSFNEANNSYEVKAYNGAASGVKWFYY